MIFMTNRSNINRQYDYIVQTSTCKENINRQSRKSRSFRFHFTLEGEPIRVCKQFYLGTLNISQKVVYNVHDKKDTLIGTPKADARGKHPKKIILPDMQNIVRDHILSFPAVESHYCRADAKSQYLDPGLNVKKMYDLYVEQCSNSNIAPVKESFYRNIFSKEFNLMFHQRKKDRCDKCEEYNATILNAVPTNDIEEGYQQHHEKDLTRINREADKKKWKVCFVF